MMCNDAHLKRGLNLISVEYVHWPILSARESDNKLLVMTSCKQSWSVFCPFFFQLIFGEFLEQMIKISVFFLPTKQLNVQSLIMQGAAQNCPPLMI